MTSPAWKARAREQRYTCRLHAATVPSLFAPAGGRLWPADLFTFEATAKSMTVANPTGRWKGKDIAALARAIVTQTVTLSNTAVPGQEASVADAALGSR
jgi:hypothetical protein